MKRRNYTAELQAAFENGAEIVCSVAPYEGWPVVHQPRRARDPLPWVFTSENGIHPAYRYSGRDCHAVPLSEAEQFFYDYAGTSYNPETETLRDGRVRGARELAEAERKLKESDAWVGWLDDPEPLSGDCYDGTQYGYEALLLTLDSPGVVRTLAARCGIDAPEGDPYRRVIEAELAFESLA
jgi:hypothetical protein